MLIDFRSLLRYSSPASPPSSTSSTFSNTSPSSSISTSDQYPFPTNPSRVRKARHSNHPEYLPQPDAGVRDVQYFLYTLLTSRRHDCAKKYPEWVLETCMGWTGDGEELRNLTEEQLASLCPYTAVVTGIDSPKHQPGEFVPIPARFMIGQVIARYVLDKKSSENQTADIQRRLNKETRRASSATVQYQAQEMLREQGVVRATTSASRSSSRARSKHLPIRSDIQSPGGSGPSTCTAAGAGTNLHYVTDPITIPAQTSASSYVSDGKNGLPFIPNISRLALSVASGSTQNTTQPGSSYPTARMVPNGPLVDYSKLEEMKDPNQAHQQTSFIPLGAIATSNAISDDQHYQSQHRRPNLYEARDSPVNSGIISPANCTTLGEASTAKSKLPHRYAPRQSSTLRKFSTLENNPNSTLSSTEHSSNSPTIRVVQTGLVTPPVNRPHVRRRSSLAGAKLIIPETLTEGNENSEYDVDEDLRKIRHDSGVDSSLYGKQSFSTNLPPLLNCISPDIEDTASFAIINELDPPRPASVGPKLHHAKSSPLSYNTLPVAKQVTRSASIKSRHNATDLPVSTSTPPPAPTNFSEPIESKPTTLDKGRSTSPENEFVFVSDSLKQMEADYHRLKEVYEMHQTRSHTLPAQFLRKAQSDTTLYSSLDPMTGLGGSRIRTWAQSPPTQTPTPQSVIGATGRPQNPLLPQKTLMQELEERQAMASVSTKAQAIARKKHEGSMGR